METNSKANMEQVEVKTLKEYVTIISLVVTGVAFILRGMIYFYWCGYFEAFHIDKGYLSVSSDNSLYFVLLLVGAATVVCAMNYWVYLCYRNRDKATYIITLIIEYILFSAFIFYLLYVEDGQSFEYFQATGWDGVTYVCKEALFYIVVFNIYGVMYSFICEVYQKVSRGKLFESVFKGALEILKIENIKELLAFIISLLVVSSVLGAFLFFQGMNRAESKKDFRIIEEIYDADIDIVDEKYLFATDRQVRKQYYVVLYETEEKYILASLYVDTQGVEKDVNRQKVISKDDIVTYYCWNIEEFFAERYGILLEENEVITEENVERNEKTGDTDGLEITIIGAVAASVFTGICTYIVEEIKRKRKQRAEEAHAASMLYNDLTSIENYLRYERSSVNIRYTVEWQKLVSDCMFLDDQEIAYLYKIYDEAYNYNYHYALAEKAGAVIKETIPQYCKLQELLDVKKENTTGNKKENNKKYSDIIRKLENKRKGKK